MSVTALLPPSLRKYVVEQRYEWYTDDDQEVWRTVVGAIHARLRTTAHPAYVHGLTHTGMTPDAIPRIEDMDRAMSAFGWGAVCVDGFIPPRAFQAFQAMRVLPIAGAVRSKSHLDYTPAPDILHEAAGHAPLLVDREYATFVARIGAMGARTFSAPRDREAFEAVRALSILKEDPLADPDAVVASEARVHATMRDDGVVSEAARLARLYWWTIEYGLVGTPTDYRLYGAGLLSSLAESASCHDASVTKHVLSKACVGVAYDITRSQPQLFVARDFSHLHAVLDAVMADTAFMRGGRKALEVACASGEDAELTFDGGARILGKVREVTRRDGRLRATFENAWVRAAEDDVAHPLGDACYLAGEDDWLTLVGRPNGVPAVEGRLLSAAPAEGV